MEPEKILTERGVHLALFYSPYCTPCKILKPKIEELASENSINFYHINVLESKDLVETMSVAGVPMVLLIKSGYIMFRDLGLSMDFNRLHGAIKDATKSQHI